MLLAPYRVLSTCCGVATAFAVRDESQKLKGYALPDFQNKKDVGTTFTFSNSAFYTHPSGYRMTLSVGAGADTHLLVSALILEGNYDAELKWLFIGKYTFTLLNQLDDRNHETKRILILTQDNSYANSRWGISKFIPHSELLHDPVKNTQYHTLYFRLSVELAI